MEALDALSRGAPASALLLIAIVAVSVLGLFVSPALIERSLFRPYWLVRRSEYGTLIASGFVHADLVHLLFNGFTFWAFAFGLERELGSQRFLMLYAFGLLASDAGTWLQHHEEPDYRTLGASGAIMAVLFASILYFPSASIYMLPIPIPIPAPLFAFAYLGYTWYASRQARGRINHDAHLFGALAGIAFVALTDGETIGRAWRQIAG